MEYSEAIKYLYGQLPMYQRLGPAAYKNNLENTLALDALFHHPHEKFKSIHVAGTNGKGSVSHMLAAVLQQAGYKVGLYTSPHLKDYRERIKINGVMMGEAAVCRFLERFLKLNKDARIEPSFFELSVLMAFDYFAYQKVDIAVIEVGLGGRLDSTNIIRPEVAVITNISFDHTNLLGNTLSAIAYEKAGIIKKGIPVVIGETQVEVQSVFLNKAIDLGAPLVFADQDYLLTKSGNEKYLVTTQCSVIYRDIDIDLKGEYQLNNLLTVIAVIEELKRKGTTIKSTAVVGGLKNASSITGLMGRWQKIGDRPIVICDSGHNEAGIRWIVGQLGHAQYNRLHIVYGTVNDKDLSRILPLLPQKASYYFTRANIERALDENKLREQAVPFNLLGEAYHTVNEALIAAKNNAGPSDLIFVGGSTFVVAEVL